MGLRLDQLPAETVLHRGEGLDVRLAQQDELLDLGSVVSVTELVESSGGQLHCVAQ